MDNMNETGRLKNEIAELKEANHRLHKAFRYQSSLFAGFSAKHDADVIDKYMRDNVVWLPYEVKKSMMAYIDERLGG